MSSRRVILLLLSVLTYLSVRAQCTPTLNPINGTCNSPRGFQIIVPNCPGGPTPYRLIWGGCEQPTLVTVPGPGTYSTYLSGCCGGNFAVTVADSNYIPLGGANASGIPSCPNQINMLPVGQPVQPSCFGFCNGQRTVFWNGGNGNMTVTLIPAGGSTTVFPNVSPFSNQTFTNLCAGTHTLNVADANGCTATGLTFTVGQPTALGAGTVAVNPTCNGFSNGVFSVSPTGGTPGYTVVFSNNATVTIGAAQSATTGGIFSGVVSATVTDTRGCTFTTSANFTQPPVINITPTQTNITCGGACTGAASVSASGGGGAYTYTWSPGSGTNAAVSGLCAGFHTLTLTDANTCVRTQTFNITQPTSITINPTITNVVCSGSCTGGATVTATGPPPPITFTWVAAGPSTIATSPSISGRCAGVYTVVASAASDPTCTLSRTIVISQPPAITLTPVTQSVNCIGLCNGSATANVSGGNGAPYTYSWSPGGQTTASVSGLCAGNFTVRARDASSCQVTANFTIVQPTPFTFGISSSSVTCNGACTGVINASPSGGNAPYTYTLASGSATVTSNTPVFSGLCAGTYTLFVKDNSASCAQQTTVQVVQPNPLVASVNITSITCANLCNGALAGSASGGTPSYTLSWNTPLGNVPGGALTNRCAGTYTFNVTDANGCSAPPATVTLTAPPEITVSIVPTAITCFGSCNGQLSANITPAGSYSLTWSNGFSGNPNTGLCAGNYTVNVVNANGCTRSASITLAAQPVIVLTQTTTPTNCAGICDGSATISATGGAGSYTFQFNTSPPTINTSGVVTGLCAGNYIASVSDANGCSRSINFAMTSPEALSASIIDIRNSCTSCTGAATLMASGGTPPYISYVWTNSLNATVGTASVATSLCPGNYTVVATDNNSCTATRTVAISQIVIVSAINGGTGIQCFGACTGSAVASVSGGQAPYSFTWTPSAQTTATATNLCAGNYTVNISDSNNPSCISIATINVNQPSDITISATQTNISCFNSCNGAIAVTASGGTGPLTYSWAPGGQTTSSVNNLCAGVYSVFVRDANGCTKPPLTFTMAAPLPPITATVTGSNPTQCTAPNNGSICVTAGGGNGTYGFAWTPAVGGNTSCVTGLVAGTYSVVVTSGVCSNTFFTTLNNPTGPTLTPISTTSVNCNGGNTGAATYSASGAGPFTFSWSPAASFTTTGATSSASGLLSGTYVVSSSDINTCISTRTFVITQASSVTINSSIANIRCAGAACNGSIGVTASGGTGPYTFTWTPGGANTASISGLCAGTYTLNSRDNNQCPSTRIFTITTPPAIAVSTTLSNVSCNAACNGSVTASATGGTGPLSYSWLPVGAFTGSSTSTVLNLCPGSYTLLVSDANTCSTTAIANVTEPPALTSTLVSVNETCSGACNASATLSATGGAGTYSFSWSNGAVTTSVQSGLCAGNYTANVIDANGCVSSKGFTITNLPGFTVSLVPSQPRCNTACDGSISTTFSGAQGPVSFTWSPVGSGQNPVNLCPSAYTITAVDGNSCQTSGVVTLFNPPALLANVSYTDPSCNGACNGIAVATPANANGAVSYSWTPAAPNTATVNGLCPGVYTLAISDANNCSASQTFALNNPAPLNVNTSIGPATCGTNNGSITAIPTGGSPGYTFAWTSPVPPPIVTTGSVVSSLFAGIYTVVVTDAQNCTNTITIPLSNSNGPTAPVTSTNVLCNGACTGAASVGLISSGAPALAPVWIIPTPTVQGSFINNLCAGNYSVMLSDTNNCVTYTGTTITEPPPISILSNMTLPLCTGICNGTISLSTSGGVGPYTYSWTGGVSSSSVLNNACPGTYSVLVGYNSGSCTAPAQVFNVPSQTSISIAPPQVVPNRCFGDCAGAATVNVLSTSNGSPPNTATLSWSNGQTGNFASSLCSGIYSVTATDNQGCFNTFTLPVNSAPQISVTPAITEPDCGLCNGSATVAVSGGSGSSFTFNWTNGGTSSSVNNLCAGFYQVQVTDSLNCQVQQNVTINNSNGITGETVIKQDESCYLNCDGAGTVTAVGGSAPVSYSWINLNPVVTGNAASNLCAGNYFVQMTDANGCLRTASVNIGAAVNITITPLITAPSCTPGNDGSISLQVSGGTGPYTYSWTPSISATSVAANVGTGSYSVMVTDQNGAGCTVMRVVNVSNPGGPVFQVIQQNTSCNSACDGSLSLISNDVPAPGYLWSNGSTGSSVSGLCEGVITVTVTSASGCNTVRSFTITGKTLLQVITASQSGACYGDCLGSAAALPFGGTLPYTFAWSPAGSVSSQADSLCSGAYTVTVTDASGCSAVSQASISEQAPIQITPFINNTSCSSVNDGSISVTVSGGLPEYTYLWSGPGSFTAGTSSLSNILAGTYSLALSDSLNCTRDTVFEVVPTVTITADAGADQVVCPGSSLTLSGSGSQGALTYAWYTTEAPSSTLSTGVIYAPAEAIASQTYVLLAVSSNSNCFDSDTVMVEVYETPYLDAGPSHTIPIFGNVTIGGNPTSLSAGSVTWSPAFYLDDAFAQNPVASNTVDVTYTVEVNYGSGCVVSDTMRVLVYPEIRITSGFTPNNDGKNDKWIIDYIDQFPDNTVEIYNRWGELLFYSKGYNVPFDGNYNGKALPVGTYYYVINLNHPSYTKPYTGPLTIFR